MILTIKILKHFYHVRTELLTICTSGSSDIMCSTRKGVIMSLGCCVGIRYAYKYFMENGNVIIPAPVHPRKLQLIKASLSLQKLSEACNTHGASKFSLCYCIVLSKWLDLHNYLS